MAEQLPIGSDRSDLEAHEATVNVDHRGRYLHHRPNWRCDDVLEAGPPTHRRQVDSQHSIEGQKRGLFKKGQKPRRPEHGKVAAADCEGGVLVGHGVIQGTD